MEFADEFDPTTDGESDSTPDVLVVDDNGDLRDLVAEFLSNLGYRVLRASDGAEGLRLLLGGIKPQLILLDRNTPALDGPSFLEAAKRDLDGIAVVWMTGSDEDLKHAAVVATLQKPF